jgi:hypothetical protein
MTDVSNSWDSNLAEIAYYVPLYKDEVLLLEAQQRGIESIFHKFELINDLLLFVLSSL